MDGREEMRRAYQSLAVVDQSNDMPPDWHGQIMRAYAVFGTVPDSEFGFNWRRFIPGADKWPGGDREWTPEQERMHPRDTEGRWRRILGRILKREPEKRGSLDLGPQIGKPLPMDIPESFPEIPGPRPLRSVVDRDAAEDVLKTGGQRGSNPGGMYQLRNTATGEMEDVYVKRPRSTDHGWNEQLANLLYKALGVKTPEVRYNEGDDHLYSSMIPGDDDFYDRQYDPEFMEQFYRDFAIDAWLANWDVVGNGMDNVITDGKTGEPVRIDAGGSLLYRAQGAPKGRAWGDRVGELESLKEAEPNGYLYDGMTMDQELDGARRLQQMNPARLRELIDRNSPPGGFALDPNIANTLLARRAYILNHYGLNDPYA